MFEEKEQTQIVKPKVEQFDFNGGTLFLKYPDKGELKNGQPWTRDHVVEIVQGKQTLVFKTQTQVLELFDLLSKRGVREFVEKMPSSKPVSSLD